MDDKDEAAQIDSLSSDFQKLSAMSKRRDEDTESNKLNADGRAQIFDSLDLLSDNIVSKQRRPSFGPLASERRRRLQTDSEIEVEDVDSMSKQASSPSRLQSNERQRRPSFGPLASERRRRLQTDTEIEVEDVDSISNKGFDSSPSLLNDLPRERQRRPSFGPLASQRRTRLQTDGEIEVEYEDSISNTDFNPSPSRLNDSTKERRPSFGPRASILLQHKMENDVEFQVEDVDSISNKAFDSSPSLLNDLTKERRPSFGPRASILLQHKMENDAEIAAEKEDNRVRLGNNDYEIATATFLVDDDDEIVTPEENLIPSFAGKVQTMDRVKREKTDRGMDENVEESPERMLSSKNRRPSFQNRGASSSRSTLLNEYSRERADRASLEMDVPMRRIVDVKQRRPSLGPRPSIVVPPTELVRGVRARSARILIISLQ